MNTETYDPLDELSKARTALDDPGALGLAHAPNTARALAIEKIDGVLGSLSANDGNDFYGEVRFALVNLGRLIAKVQEEIPVAEAPELVDAIGGALDALDAAINEAVSLP